MTNLGLLALAAFVFLAGKAKASSAPETQPGPQPGDVPTQLQKPTIVAQQEERPIGGASNGGGSGLPSAKEAVSILGSVLNQIDEWKAEYYGQGGFTNGEDT